MKKIRLIVLGMCMVLAFSACVSNENTDKNASDGQKEQEQLDNKKEEKMIRLNVFIQVDEKNRAELIETAKELVEASQKDSGCISYDLFESATRPDVLMICETWKDDESLSAHSQAPHFTKLVPKIESLGTMKTERFEF